MRGTGDVVNSLKPEGWEGSGRGLAGGGVTSVISLLLKASGSGPAAVAARQSANVQKPTWMNEFVQSVYQRINLPVGYRACGRFRWRSSSPLYAT